MNETEPLGNDLAGLTIMGWFSPNEVPEEREPAPVRLASPEFVSGLVEIAELYERRETAAREQVKIIADDLSLKTYFNYGDVDRYLGRIREAMARAIDNQAAASEMRDRIRSYEYQGRRPPYMPAPPTPPAKPYEGGE
jgi:hypothetical protein